MGMTILLNGKPHTIPRESDHTITAESRYGKVNEVPKTRVHIMDVGVRPTIHSLNSTNLLHSEVNGSAVVLGDNHSGGLSRLSGEGIGEAVGSRDTNSVVVSSIELIGPNGDATIGVNTKGQQGILKGITLIFSEG
jgi:hypothetical protein